MLVIHFEVPMNLQVGFRVQVWASRCLGSKVGGLGRFRVQGIRSRVEDLRFRFTRLSALKWFGWWSKNGVPAHTALPPARPSVRPAPPKPKFTSLRL